MEAVLGFTPTGIDWTARGVEFLYSFGNPSPKGKFAFRLWREKIGSIVGQSNTDTNRAILVNDATWNQDGDSDPGDAQYPTTAKPNKAFRIDDPALDLSGFKQLAMRADFRESAQWLEGSRWTRINTWSNAEWHVNITAVLPNHAKGGENSNGAGATAGNIPNNPPVANAGPNQTVVRPVVVNLTGAASSDADNDSLTYEWTPPAGITLNPANNVKEVWFNTPNNPGPLTFTLKVKDKMADLRAHAPGNSEATAQVVITVK
jgi:hypothetical protein